MLPDRYQLLSQIAAELRNHEKRLERLESLEFMNIVDATGCIAFRDYDQGLKATFRVDAPNPAPVNGDDLYYDTNLTIFWNFWTSSAPPITLHLRVDGLATATYSYAYSFTQGGATTDVGADGQTSWIVGRLGQYWSSVGEIHFPLWAREHQPRALGEWTSYNASEGAGSRTERGNWGGHQGPASRVPLRFDFFASAGNMTGAVMLYGWCPKWNSASGPLD